MDAPVDPAVFYTWARVAEGRSISRPCQQPGRQGRGEPGEHRAAHLHHEQSFTSKRSRSFSIVFLRGGTGEAAVLGRGAGEGQPRSPQAWGGPAPLGARAPPPPRSPRARRGLTRCPRRRRRWRPGRPPRCACCACGRQKAAVRSRRDTRVPSPPSPPPLPPAHRAPTNSSQGGRRRHRCTVSKGPKLRVRYSTLSEQLWSKSTLGATFERPAPPAGAPAAAMARASRAGAQRPRGRPPDYGSRRGCGLSAGTTAPGVPRDHGFPRACSPRLGLQPPACIARGAGAAAAHGGQGPAFEARARPRRGRGKKPPVPRRLRGRLRKNSEGRQVSTSKAFIC